jgi:Cupredoxin-like domain
MPGIGGRTLLALAVVLVSCADGSGGRAGGGMDRAEPPCEPSRRLELRAEGHSFGTPCLAVQADRVVRASLENLDLEPHNFALYQEVPGPNQEELSPPNLLVRSETVFSGPPSRFEVPALRPGAYFFRCDFHPEMTGTLHAV